MSKTPQNRGGFKIVSNPSAVAKQASLIIKIDGACLFLMISEFVFFDFIYLNNLMISVKKCLIIYPDTEGKDDIPLSLTENKIKAYRDIYKLGLKLPYIKT